ncbi:hypothetical protein [Bradyrhizobium sp. USDA 4508]
MTLGAANPPKLSYIAQVIRRLAVRFSKEKLSSSNGQQGAFHSAVFGWCPHLKRFAVYELQPRQGPSQFDIECTEHLPNGNQEVVCFGTGKPRLIELIEKIAREGDKHHRTARVPLLATEALLSENKIDDVGGSLSIGFSNTVEFQLFAHVTPSEPGSSMPKTAFNGIDLDEVGSLGHLVVSLIGIA